MFHWTACSMALEFCLEECRVKTTWKRPSHSCRVAAWLFTVPLNRFRLLIEIIFLSKLLWKNKECHKIFELILKNKDVYWKRLYIYNETSIYCSWIIRFPRSVLQFLWSLSESYFSYGSRIYCFPGSIISFSDLRRKRWIEVSLYICIIHKNQHFSW
jgi:hypothetical protein